MRMVSGLNTAPTGCCIQPLAIRIHSAEKLEPMATSQVTVEMAELGQPVPAEEEQADEGRFQKERHQAFDGERRAENVADIVRVVGPVGAELEFHGDAGGDPHGEIDAEQLAPEPRRVAPDLAAGHHIGALHDGEQKRQAERERHEQKVIERGDRELQPRQDDGIEMRHEPRPYFAVLRLRFYADHARHRGRIDPRLRAVGKAEHLYACDADQLDDENKHDRLGQRRSRPQPCGEKRAHRGENCAQLLLRHQISQAPTPTNS